MKQSFLVMIKRSFLMTTRPWLFIGIFFYPFHFSVAWTHLGSSLQGWPTKKVVFYVNPTNCTIPESTLNDLLDSVMNVWNSIPNSGLEVERSRTTIATTVAEFNAGTATQVPVILCDPDMSQADSIPGVTTNTLVNTSGNIIYSGILLNANTSGAAEISQLTRAELEVTLAHEMGHALGLGHSSDPKALMYYSIGGKPTAIITQDDADGISQIYPKSEFSGGGFGCAAIHEKNAGQKVYWFWIGLGLILLNLVLGRFYLK